MKPLTSGSWTCSDLGASNDVPNLINFAPGGAVTAAYIQYWYTAAFGTWADAPDGHVDLTIRAYTSQENGYVVHRVITSGRLTHDAARDVWTGSYRVEQQHVTDNTNTVTTGKWELQRIEIAILP